MVNILVRKFDPSSNKEMKVLNFMTKNNKKILQKYKKAQNSSILYSELAPLTRYVTSSKLHRDEKDIGDKKLSMEHVPIFHVYFNDTRQLYPLNSTA